VLFRSWFHEIGSDDCPHGPEPDDENSPEFEAWEEATSARHTGSPQDVRICLDAPAGDACGACSDDVGEMVPWSACRARDHARTFQIASQPQHQPVTADVAAMECWERECDDFFTDDGDEIPDKDTCTHMRQMEICEACSEPGAAEDYPPVVAWADCTKSSTKAGAAR